MHARIRIRGTAAVMHHDREQWHGCSGGRSNIMHRENISCLPGTSTRGTETPKGVRETERTEREKRTTSGQGTTNVYCVRYTERERGRGGRGVRVYGNCDAMGTAHGTQWRRRWTASLFSSPRFPAIPSSQCLAFGHFRGHLRCAYIRLSSETAVLEPSARWQRLLRCPRGSKPDPCVLRPGVRCVVGAGVIYPMGIYTVTMPHDFLASPSAPSRFTLPSPDGRRQRRRQVREATARDILPRVSTTTRRRKQSHRPRLESCSP